MSAAVLEVISENARFGPQRSWDSLFLKISIGFVWLLDQMTHKKWLVWLTIWLVGKVILRNLDFLFFFFSCFLSSSPSRLVGVLLELGRLLTSTLVMKACPS